MKKIMDLMLHPRRMIISLASRNIIKLPDKVYLKLLYKERTGKKLNLDNPKGFNEKLQWLKLNDRKEIYITIVDKFEAKKYVAERIGEEYIIPTLGVYDKFDEINFNDLPNQFVLKTTHDSGGVVICKDKSNLNIQKARKKINKSLRHNFFYNGREWPYKNVKPRIIVEKYMKDDNTEDLLDYKLMCFNGKVKCSFICSDRYNKEKGLAVDFYDTEWKHMPFRRKYRNSDTEIDKPLNYEKMVELAEKLSTGMPFVRVDFYEVNGKIYFGELTLYPGNGLEKFEPDEWDYKIGSFLDLNLVKGKNNEQ